MSREETEQEIVVIRRVCRPDAKNLVTVFDSGAIPGDIAYIDMELCDLDLRHFLDIKWDSGAWTRKAVATVLGPIEEVISARNIMIDIVKGLAYLHGQRLVHRDVKPSNGMP